MFKAKFFQKQTGLFGGLSQRSDGPMELATQLKVREPNRRKYFKAQHFDFQKVASATQSHSRVVALASQPKRYKGDALVTTQKKLILTVTVADCFPIYFYNPKVEQIGIAHSGWRGTVSNIAAAVVKKLNHNPKDLMVLIGPGIQSCHFEIKGDVLPKFKNHPSAITKRNQKIYINLPKIIKSQLIKIGVKPKNIEISPVCTFCERKRYFSFRRDKPKKVQPMLAWILQK